MVPLRKLIGGYIAVYPTLLLVLYATRPLTQDMAFPYAIGVNALILVPCILFVSIPLNQKLMAKLWPLKPAS